MNRAWKQALLDGLRQQRILGEPAAQRLQQQDAVPWFMGLLSGGAAWLAALLLTVSMLLMLDGSPLAAGIVGVVVLGVAVGLLRRPGVFVSQFGLALSLVGQGMLVLAISQLDLWSAHQERPSAAVAALVAIGMLWVPAAGVHRLACALIALSAGAVFIGFNGLLAIYGVSLAAVAAWLWLARSRWAGSDRAGLWRALAEATSLMALIVPMLGGWHWASPVDREVGLGWAWLYPLGAGVLLLCVVCYLLRGQSLKVRLGAVVAALLLTLPGTQAPGLLVAAVLWLAVFHASDRLWCVLMGGGAALYLGNFYYSLHISLLQKSIWLVVGGALLLMLRWCLLRRAGANNET